MLVASRKVTIPTNDQVPKYLGPAFDEAYALVRRTGAKEAGPCMALWHQPAAVVTNEVVEAIVPIDRPVEAIGDVAVYELSGAAAISVIHRGSFANFPRAHAALLSWMEDNRYTLDGPYREVYIQNDPARPDDAVVEIQYPVSKTS